MKVNWIKKYINNAMNKFTDFIFTRFDNVIILINEYSIEKGDIIIEEIRRRQMTFIEFDVKIDKSKNDVFLTKFLNKLPENVKSVVISGHNIFNKLGKLPDSLYSLSYLTDCYYENSDKIRELTIYYHGKDIIERFSDKLESLTYFGFIGKIVNLPENLKELSLNHQYTCIDSKNNDNVLSDRLVNIMPIGLGKLFFSGNFIIQRGLSFERFEGMREMRFSYLNIDGRVFERLPVSLVILELKSVHTNFLKLGKLINLRSLSIEEIQVMFEEGDESFSLIFPPFIQTLYYGIIDGRYLRNLPETLKFLKINNQVLLNNSCLVTLPMSLERLEYMNGYISVIRDCYEYFPLGMVLLVIFEDSYDFMEILKKVKSIEGKLEIELPKHYEDLYRIQMSNGDLLRPTYDELVKFWTNSRIMQGRYYSGYNMLRLVLNLGN